VKRRGRSFPRDCFLSFPSGVVSRFLLDRYIGCLRIAAEH
jgi:hypothetical protein